MKPKKLSLLLTILPMIIAATGCHSRQESKVDITPHCINLQADSLYRQAMTLMESSCDVDSTRKCIRFLDKALAIDSLNPDYYGMKAKLLSEIGELDSALYIQTLAMEKNAITGEYLFQLGLLQAAKDMHAEAHESFGKSKVFLGECPQSPVQGCMTASIHQLSDLSAISPRIHINCTAYGTRNPPQKFHSCKGLFLRERASR